MSAVLSFRNVSFTYPGAAEPVFKGLCFTASRGWTVFAGPNGIGKTTLLSLACGLLKPSDGEVSFRGSAYCCPQRTDDPPEGMIGLIGTGLHSEPAYMLGIGSDWYERWHTLSHGERKRAQLATALWSEPDLLAVDEPVNHLDPDARALVFNALSRFQGVGLLVCHDRSMMDSLAVQCGLLSEGGSLFCRGGYTMAEQEDRLLEEGKREERRRAEKHWLRLKRDARMRLLNATMIQASGCGRRVSFRDVCRFNIDGPSRVDGAVQKAGRLCRIASARAEKAREAMESVTYRKEYDRGIHYPVSDCGRNTLFDHQPEVVPLAGGSLALPSLAIRPGDRIALTGANGSGKSTLVGWLVDHLQLPPGRVLHIPQEITARESSAILENARALSRDELGMVMTGVRRLGSRPEAILESGLPSPGETRKLLLCLGMLKRPWVLFMDEPTNHMDLPGIRCLEEALDELSCAILLVSHDSVFLKRITRVEWRIRSGVLQVLQG